MTHPHGRWFDFQVAAAVGIVRALGPTLRVRWHHAERVDHARSVSGMGVIYAFWHQRLLPFCYTHRDQRIQVMVSTHRDGELITRVIARLGFGAVRGSSTRHGTKALFGMAAERYRTLDLAVTPDGPRGPRQVLKQGLVMLARRTGRIVIPIANSTWPRIELKSWDRFHLPLAGAKCAVVLGEPWEYDRRVFQSLEEARRDLESRVAAVTAEADRLVRR